MTRRYTRGERYKPIFDASTWTINTDGKARPLFVGFDSGAPGKEVADRIRQYVDWCGRRSIVLGERGLDLPPIVMIVTLHADESVPSEVSLTAREGGKTCRVTAHVVRLATMSLEDLAARNWHMLVPFYFSRYEELYPEMEKDPGKRAGLLEDARSAIRILKGPLRHESKRGELLEMMREILETYTKEYPELRAEIRGLFEGE